MNTKHGFFLSTPILLALSVLLIGCEATDVVASYARASFSEVIAVSGSRVRPTGNGYWELQSPAGDRLLLASDFSATKDDAEYVFDAAPFLSAGLDPARLSGSDGVTYRLDGKVLHIGFDLGSTKFNSSAGNSLAGTFAEIVRNERNRIGYHEKLDHYGIKLGDGNMFEWAKDMSKNDKDIVFVLNPAPFIAAGVNPSAVAGWSSAKVEMKDDSGKTVFVDKLLKPFDIR